jgi:hypothetical protein
MISSENENTWQLPLIRSIGYGLLAFAAVDLVAIFLPPSFGDAQWEFATLGDVVERVPVPLLGLVLTFWGGEDRRRIWELWFLKLASWATLLVGLLFLALIALGLSATLRINNINNVQIDNQYREAVNQAKATRTQVNRVKERVNTAKPEDLQKFLRQLDERGLTQGVQSTQELRARLVDEVKVAEEKLNKQEIDVKRNAEVFRSTKLKALLKSSLKWNLGALLASFLFVTVWRHTAWTRRRLRKKKQF